MDESRINMEKRCERRARMAVIARNKSLRCKSTASVTKLHVKSSDRCLGRRGRASVDDAAEGFRSNGGKVQPLVHHFVDFADDSSGRKIICFEVVINLASATISLFKIIIITTTTTIIIMTLHMTLK